MKKLQEYKCAVCSETSGFMVEDGEEKKLHCMFCSIESVLEGERHQKTIPYKKQTSSEYYNCHKCKHYGKAHFPMIGKDVDKTFLPNCKKCGSGDHTEWTLAKGLTGTFFQTIDYGCNICGHRGKSLGEITDGVYMMDTFDPCESCTSTDIKKLISIPTTDRFGERFPMLDRGLGMWLDSPKQRLEVCKQRGLIPLDSDFDISPCMEKIRTKHKKEDEKFDKLKDKVENAPEFASLRKAQASGLIGGKKKTKKEDS